MDVQSPHEPSPPPILEYRRKPRTCYRLAITIACLLVLYSAGYYWLRRNHHLVHWATFYTDSHGRFVKTDSIELGEYRSTMQMRTAYVAYSPLRCLEGLYWQHLHPSPAPAP